jgi:hypothetical protein
MGPDDSPERMGYLTQKKEQQTSLIRETLNRQIKENKMRKRQEKESDDAYGQKLGHMALIMQNQEIERQRKQREMHFQQLTRQWDELKKNKEEIDLIEKIYR